MIYSVAVTFDCPESPEDVCLASLRSSVEPGGWSIRLAAETVQVQGVDGYRWIAAPMQLYPEGNFVEWRVIDNRHELYFHGKIATECMSALSLPAEANVYIGGDPLSDLPAWPHVTSVEVTGG